MTGVTGHCVLPLCPRSAARSRPRHCTPRPRHCTPGPRRYWGPCLPRPPHRSTSLGTDQVSASCIVRPQWLTFAATSTPRHSRGSHDAQDLMGRPRRPVFQGWTTPTTTPPQEQATGRGHAAPVGTTPHSNTCTALVLPSTIKGGDLGHLEGGERPGNTENTHAHIPAA